MATLASTFTGQQVFAGLIAHVARFCIPMPTRLYKPLGPLKPAGWTRCALGEYDCVHANFTVFRLGF